MSLGKSTTWKIALPLDDVGRNIWFHSRIPLNRDRDQRIQRQGRNRDKDLRAQTWQNLTVVIPIDSSKSYFSETPRQTSQKISNHRKYYETRLFHFVFVRLLDEAVRKQLVLVAFNWCAPEIKVWNPPVCSLKEWSSCLEVVMVQNSSRVFPVVKGFFQLLEHCSWEVINDNDYGSKSGAYASKEV
jgi:hypothetical protein